jgi:hypothetical protein
MMVKILVLFDVADPQLMQQEEVRQNAYHKPFFVFDVSRQGANVGVEFLNLG